MARRQVISAGRPQSLRRLGEPAPVDVAVDPAGRPETVDGSPVIAVRETWLIEDRWWTPRPIRRHYWEVVTDAGAVRTIYRKPGGSWRIHG